MKPPYIYLIFQHFTARDRWEAKLAGAYVSLKTAEQEKERLDYKRTKEYYYTLHRQVITWDD